MTEPIRAGILGTGHGHAAGKLKVLQQSPEWELAGVCEPDPQWKARRQGEADWAGVRWVTEAELLDDPSVRMVAVESEVPQLLPLAQKAVAAGKHLHLDKPAGTDLPTFRRLLDEAASRSLIIQMGYMFRYNPGFDLIRRAVGEGWLGTVYSLRGGISTDLRPEARKRLAFHPGGMMLELGCHLIDMLVLLMGRPGWVTPFLRHDGPETNGLADNTLAVMEYDGALALIESAAMEAQPFPRRRFEVIGTEGTILLQPLEPPAVRLCLREPRGGFQAGWQTVEVENPPRYDRDLEELARSIREEQAFPYSYEHDYTVQETVLRACGRGIEHG
jgi:predicted dehydrogenase